MTQLSIEDAIARRDLALSRVEANAGTWTEEAYAFLVAYAREHPEIFVDDLWRAGLRRPSNPKALGAVMQRAARAGLMERCGSKPSAASHAAHKPLWRSKVYGGQP